MITPDVACGGIRGLVLDTGHRQVLPGRAGKVLRTGYRSGLRRACGVLDPREGCRRPQELIQLDMVMYVIWTLHWILYDCVRHGHDILDIMH